jgi:hypothetical protein
MPIGYNPNVEVISLNNTSTSNLAASATFTGAGDDVTEVDVIHVNLFATQPCTILVEQGPDGTNWDISDSFSSTANIGFSTSVGAVAKFSRVKVTNNGGSSTTSFRLNTQYSSSISPLPRKTGQAAMANSVPVTFASDQSNLNVAVISTPSPTPEASGFSFGQITLANIAEIFLRKATYTEQTSNAQRSVKSSNANDSSAGTGVRTVKITYYTSTLTGPFTETITMNGTSGVNTTNTDICYIEKIEALTVGSGGVAAGNITVQSTTGGGGVVIKQLSTGDLESLDSVHYIATGATLYITGMSCGHNGTTVGSGARYRLRKQVLGTANSPLIQVSDFVRLYGQSSTFARDYTSNIIITGPAKVELWVLPETSSSTIYYGSFDYFTR